MVTMKHISGKSSRDALLAGLLVASAVMLGACSGATGGAGAGIQVGTGQISGTAEERSIASVALSCVGSGYADYMAGPKQFDNSGLVYYAYRQNGRPLPRSLADQLDAGLPVATSAAQLGDLVFFRVDSPDARGRLRVGVLVGDNLVVIALPGTDKTDGGVRRVSLSDPYWARRLVGISHIAKGSLQ